MAVAADGGGMAAAAQVGCGMRKKETADLSTPLPRISCHATLDKAACAPFRKERRMKCINANGFDRKTRGSGVERSAVLLLALLCLLLASIPAHASVYYVTVAGLGGEPDYDQRFTANAKDLDKLFKASGNGARVYTLTGAEATKAQLTATLTSIAHDAKPGDDFVLMLIGHGSYDGADYKFNLVGPDVTATDLAALCDRIPSRRQLIVNATSASGGSVAALEKPGRGVIAATKTGTEKNATVFARYWVEALQDPTADLDKSDSISAMEAFAYAQRKTAAFYESQKRLATEHPVFEDTGKNEPVREASKTEGTLLANFTVLRIGAAQKQANDPAKQALLAKKEDLEQKIDALKYQKAAMDPADYKQQLTAALVQLAQVQQELDK
jgi:hypothetical protein